MPIITISRGSYSQGKEIAEKVAAQLGYWRGTRRASGESWGGMDGLGLVDENDGAT